MCDVVFGGEGGYDEGGVAGMVCGVCGEVMMKVVNRSVVCGEVWCVCCGVVCVMWCV